MEDDTTRYSLESLQFYFISEVSSAKKSFFFLFCFFLFFLLFLSCLPVAAEVLIQRSDGLRILWDQHGLEVPRDSRETLDHLDRWEEVLSLGIPDRHVVVDPLHEMLLVLVLLVPDLCALERLGELLVEALEHLLLDELRLGLHDLPTDIGQCGLSGAHRGHEALTLLGVSELLLLV